MCIIFVFNGIKFWKGANYILHYLLMTEYQQSILSDKQFVEEALPLSNIS